MRQKKPETQSPDGVRTYPIQFPAKRLDEIKKEADKQGLTIKAFIHNAINAAMSK